MTHEIDAKRLNEWVRAISTTEDVEIDCDALIEVIQEVVEVAGAGKDVRSLLPDIAVHLDHCADCREWYETLVALLKESN